MISRVDGDAMASIPEVDEGGLETGFSSSKKQILLTLKRQGAVSLTDLAASLRISQMATLKHLAVLEGKGLVERSFRAAGRGRPRAFFALSRGSTGLFPEAYTHMTLCALRFIEEKIGREAVERLLKQRAQEVLDANRNRVPDGSLKEKVAPTKGQRDDTHESESDRPTEEWVKEGDGSGPDRQDRDEGGREHEFPAHSAE